MNYLVIAAIFAASIYQTVRRGPAATFTYVFLPVLLLLAVVKPVQISGFPDISSPMAVAYGTVVGMLIAGRLPGFRPHPIDALVVVLSLTVVITGLINGEFWTLVSSTAVETMRWLVPYYMARLAFRDATLRRHATYILACAAMFMAFIGLIEFRLWPLFFSRLLSAAGLSVVINEAVLGRWNFFRAMVTAEHPIDFGNVGLILCGMIPALAVTAGVRLKDWRVMGGVAAALVIVFTSISFSSFLGLFAAGAIFVTLRYVRGSELLLVPGTIALMIGMFVFTQRLLDDDLEALKPQSEDAAAIDGSYYVRVLIVQRSWENAGKDAGLFGFGDINITKQTLGLDSVDNSYMLFLMRRGWIHLMLRLLLGVSIALIATRALRRARGQAMRLPPAAAAAALLGTMVSMYTVWFGFVYAVLWTLLLGMFVTMRQMMQAHAAAVPDAGRGSDATPRPSPRPGSGPGSRPEPFAPSPRPLIARAGDSF